MSTEVKERVFEPFFTTKESGKGTGLGLSMVYGFVRQSEGQIEIDSAPDAGTTIRVLLPRAEGAEHRSATIRALPVPPRRGDGETILVVEDDEKVRQVTVSTLRSLGFAVLEAGDGDEAMATLAAGNGEGIDLVFSDVKMPGSLGGADLARRIEAEWPRIKVLLTSGYVEAEDDLARFGIIFKPYGRARRADPRPPEALGGPARTHAPLGRHRGVRRPGAAVSGRARNARWGSGTGSGRGA
jgi:CheY-like chemotaxis protein